MHWRHEWKHEISPADALVIRQRMGVVGTLDPHARDGCYAIRSVYFDNGSDKSLREKLDGVDHRDKWRIRMYDGDPSLIHLERKSKRHGLGTKDPFAPSRRTRPSPSWTGTRRGWRLTSALWCARLPMTWQAWACLRSLVHSTHSRTAYLVRRKQLRALLCE